MEFREITRSNDFLQTCFNKSVDFSNFLSTSSTHLEELLRFWVLNEVNVPKSSVTNLLKLLRTFQKDLPQSFKTLLPTPKLQYKRCDEGEYVHFDNWTSALKQILLHSILLNADSSPNIKKYFMVINIDGAPIFNHSPDFKLFPIFVTIYSCENMTPVCAGMYCSNKSSQRNLPIIHVFLKQFLDDVKFLYDNPFCFGDSSFALSNMRIYVCDAPMRSPLKCIKAHSGCYSCERCIVCGVYDEQTRHVCLTDLS